MLNAVRTSALFISLFAFALGPAAFAASVIDRDAAIQIGEKACGRALNVPSEDHPHWDALPIGDHWSARLLSDYAPYPESPLLSVDVAPDGTTSDCIAHVGG